MSFDLDALIRRTLDQDKEPDPAVIARRMVARIPEQELRSVLAVTLRHHVREAIRQRRTGAISATNSTRNSPLSARWAAVRAARVFNGTEWKFEADCTADDLDGVAAEYRRREQENARLAAHYEALAAELRRTGARTLADLNLEAAA